MKVEKHLTAVAGKKQELLQQFKQQNQQLLCRKTSVWTREKTNQLIELYKKHECLWNNWHVAYKSRDKRKRAIEDICTILQVPNFEFGKKIHNLRNQFNMEMKKLEQRVEEAGVSMDDATATELRCKWSHFESLMFLRHVIEPRPSGYQNAFHTAKKMRVRYDMDCSENDSSVLAGTSGKNNSKNPEDFQQFQYDDNVTEEIITNDYQSFEEEVVDQQSSEEVCDRKYQPPPQQLTKQIISPSVANKESHPTTNSLASQTDKNIDDDSSVIEMSSSNFTLASSQQHVATAASSTSPLQSSCLSSISSSNRPISVLRDQWDAFGELVANEFRNLNSEISRKRLKRKIMQAMLEVGEEDDNITNRSRNS